MCDRPFVEMRAGLRHSVGETQLEILAAQRVLPVVLDEGNQAGKVQVGCQKVVGASPLVAHANATVLDTPVAPKTHQEEPGHRGHRYLPIFFFNSHSKIPIWLESHDCYQKDRV